MISYKAETLHAGTSMMGGAGAAICQAHRHHLRENYALMLYVLARRLRTGDARSLKTLLLADGDDSIASLGPSQLSALAFWKQSNQSSYIDDHP